jgi:N-acetylmuramoyl-L-alanine amidase
MINRPFKIDFEHPLPHYRDRTEPIKYAIIHCSRGTPEQQLEIMDKNKLSVHYIIDNKGKVTSVVPEDKVAYHAGLSRWKGSKGISLNGSSIGIEIQSPDMGQRHKSYSSSSTTKLCILLAYLMKKYKIRRENILGHSDIAPTRKPDPGAGFPWKKLFKQDVLFWYHKSMRIRSDDEKELLEIIGYDTSVIEAARYAFCRRYMPEEVEVIDDIQYLVDNPYPLDFTPQDRAEYMLRLQSVACAFEEERKKDYWIYKD